MMRAARRIPIVFALGLAIACASVAPGSDPVVVHAEQAQVIAFDVCDFFLTFEKAHQAQLPAEVHAAAETIRKHGPDAFRALRLTIESYKANRTPEGKADLVTALSVVQQLWDIATKYIAASQGVK